jgi:ribonuclease HI
MFYSVQKGHETGVFDTWVSCQKAIHGYSGAVYKKCKTREEAEAFAEPPAPPPTPAVSRPPTPPTRDPDYYVYTDGACSNNGGKGAKAGLGVWFGPSDPRNVSRALEGKQTNNTAELQAILQALQIVEPDVKKGTYVGLMTDSKYGILCLTTYGDRCNVEGWKKDIPNKELVRLCYETYKRVPVRLQHVDAHTGGTDVHSVGNDGADRLANEAIGLTSCPYASSGKEKVYINVPYSQKEVAKSYGARWDPETKKWYCFGEKELLERFGSY